jgi:peptidoglycan hydrolase-like protein with peptidoglycan-binding domain
LQLGLNTGITARVGVDCQFGPNTAKAVGEFQKRHALPMTYLPDNATTVALAAAGAGDPPIPGSKSATCTESDEKCQKHVQVYQPEFLEYQPSYLKWVQDSLNRTRGLSLTVNGEFGADSRAALRDFQKSVGIKPSGVMNCLTEIRLIQKNGCRRPHPEVKAQLTTQGYGFYSYKTHLRHKQFALPETMAALISVGFAWYAAHPKGPRIGIGEISLQGGGCIQGHASHQMGVDVDIALMRNDGLEKHTRVGAAAYSRSVTQELVRLLFNTGMLTVRHVFLNDTDIEGAQEEKNHDDHMHVRFKLPPRFS